MMTPKKVFLLFVLLFSSNITAMPSTEEGTPKELKFVILGLGGRVNRLLLDCLRIKEQVHKTISVVAIGDDNATESIEFFTALLKREHPEFVDEYAKIFQNTKYYSNSDEDLHTLFTAHQDIDKVFITSPNYDHYRHLNVVLQNSSCKQVYMEKPLFQKLEEFENFGTIPEEFDIAIGLTLRYTNMARIVRKKLLEFREELGSPTKVRSWEYVKFGHGLTAFFMGWRRNISQSGGFLLEKSIHDLDLSLFFLQSIDAFPEEITLTTNATHSFFKKSNKERILQEILSNRALEDSTANWEKTHWRNLFSFVHNQDNSIDWTATFDHIFESFPDDDDFSTSDIIPDHQTIKALITTANGDEIEYELEVKIDEFSTKAKRGLEFHFERGTVHVDIMKGEMSVILSHDNYEHKFDLCSDNTDHSGGNVFIAHDLLNNPINEQHKATFNDPVAQLATIMGLLSEHQALYMIDKPITVKNVNGEWRWKEVEVLDEEDKS